MLIGDLAIPDLAGNDGLTHIIWNVLLCDKTADITANLVAENRIGHILAILPNKSALPERARALDLPISVLAYGDAHEPCLTSEQRVLFDTAGSVIDAAATADERKIVLVFCNSGYQRSLPFLVYYLTTRHPTEAPTVARAVDMILPQVDRTGYAASRDRWITAVETVLAA